MKNCLLCNEEFEGSDPICPKCTAEHLAASSYKDDEEEVEEAAPDGGVGLSHSLESVAHRGKVTPPPRAPAHKISGNQAVRKSGPTTTPRPGGRTPAAPKSAPVALANDDQVKPGTVLLGQFRVDRKLGEGGFGAVYLAEQIGLERKAVVKVCHPSLAQNPTFVARFHREAKVLAALDHHHLVKIFNFGQLPSGTLFLVMEYGGDKTLGEELKASGGKMELRRALHIISQVLDALSEAHSHGIVHRDLKPANILLGKKSGEEWVKIVDVGIAKVMHAEEEKEDERLTGTGMVVGTPSYYSPEQARGLEVDGRSDLYAAGIVLYEMLTGQLPIKGKTPIDFVRAHAVDEPTPASAYGVQLPDVVDKIIMRSLEKDPAKRFASAQTMKGAIDAVRVQISSAHGLPAATGSSLRKKLLIAAAGLTVVIAGLVVAMFMTSGPDKRKPPVTPPAPVKSPDSAPPLAENIAKPPAPAPAPAQEPPKPADTQAAPAADKPPAVAAATPVTAPPVETPSKPPEETAAPPPPPAEKVEKPVHLLVKAPGGDIKIIGAESSDGDVTLTSSKGQIKAESTDGWTVVLQYRRRGSSLEVKVESKPRSLVSVDDDPKGPAATVTLAKGANARVGFKNPTQEYSLIMRYTP